MPVGFEQLMWLRMPLYLVDRNLPGVSRDQFRAAQRAMAAAARASNLPGAVHYLRGVFVPSQGRAFCLFEAPDADSVRAVNAEAGLPFNCVVEAVEFAVDGPRAHEGDLTM